MGLTGALGFAGAVDEGQISLATALSWHLTSNHFPPHPTFFIPTCEAAIEAAQEGDSDRLIDLPEQVTWNDDRTTVEAWRIIESFHLDAFVGEG